MQGPSTLRFGRCEVRPLERALWVDGAPAAVGARAFDVLMALIARQGRIVTRAELLDAVWPDLVVEDNNLTVQIATLRKVLGPEVIVTVPGRGYQLAAGHADAASGVAPAAAPAPVPPVADDERAATALFGRDTDLAALMARVGAPVLSIVGTGGVGKTALARALVDRQQARWPDGVHWIELAPLADPLVVPKRIAASLNVELGSAAHTHEALLSALAQRQALVVLDNCEHLLEAVAGIIEPALAVAPSVQWLLTSQEPLRLASESVYRLDTLEVPAAGMALDEARRHGALALLEARARAADRRFALTPANLDVAIDLCRQLDGLPLATEMAATRIASLGLEGVRDRLGRQLRILAGTRTAPARQRTLRAALDWSHGLLSAAEQRLFRRLAPFVGGFTLEMAQQVAREADASGEAIDEWAALDCLTALVDKSLVQARGGDRPRYVLLESAREYGYERLAEAGEVDLARTRHAACVAWRFADCRREAETLPDADWLARYQPEQDNLSAALAWACRGDDADVLARLIAALGFFEFTVQRVSTLLTFDVPTDLLRRAAAPLRGAALVELSWTHYVWGHRTHGARMFGSALQAFREAGDDSGAYRALSQLMRLYSSGAGTIEQAHEAERHRAVIDERCLPPRTAIWCTIFTKLCIQPLRPAQESWRELMSRACDAGFVSLAAACRVYDTNEFLVNGDFAGCVRVSRAHLDAVAKLPRARALILSSLALALMQLGQDDEAVAAAHESIRTFPSATRLVAGTLALGALRQGRFHDAARLLGHVNKQRTALSSRFLVLDLAEGQVGDEIHSALQANLGADELEQLLADGAALSSHEVLALASTRMS